MPRVGRDRAPPLTSHASLSFLLLLLNHGSSSSSSSSSSGTVNPRRFAATDASDRRAFRCTPASAKFSSRRAAPRAPSRAGHRRIASTTASPRDEGHRSAADDDDEDNRDRPFADAGDSDKIKGGSETAREAAATASGAPGSGASGGGSSKRAKNKKRREAQQEFTHSWMVGALKGHTAPVLDMNFSSNGKFLASCAEDRTVFLWCTKDLAQKDRKSLRVNIEFDHATLVRWSPDGKAFIIHKALANTLEVYKVAKKPFGFIIEASKAVEFPQKHTDDVVGMDIACTGKYIITCSKLNCLIVWDLKGQPLATIEMHLGTTYRARVSPCGRFVAASGFTPDVNVWEVVFSKSGEFKQVSKAFDLAGHSSGIYDFGFNADTSHMATVSKDGTYRFYDTKIEFEKGEDPHVLLTGSWEGTPPANLALSPNAEVLAIAHGSSLSFYSTLTGELDNTIHDIFTGPITCLAFNAVGDYVLVAGDKHIKIFRNVTGYRVAIESARRKLAQKQTSATKERLEQLIATNKQLLLDMGERCPE